MNKLSRWTLRTKFLLGVMGIMIVIVAGLIIWGVANGKIKTFADVFPYGNGSIRGHLTTEPFNKNALVICAMHNKDQDEYETVGYATSSDSGYFAFDGLSEGANYVIGTVNGCFVGRETVDNLQGVVTKDIIMAPKLALGLKGTVYDAESHAPISGAEIKFTIPKSTELKEVTYQDTSNADGSYDMETTFAGSGTLKVTSPDYNSVSQSIVAIGCEINTVNIYMQRASSDIQVTVSSSPRVDWANPLCAAKSMRFGSGSGPDTPTVTLRAGSNPPVFIGSAEVGRYSNWNIQLLFNRKGAVKGGYNFEVVKGVTTNLSFNFEITDPTTLQELRRYKCIQ